MIPPVAWCMLARLVLWCGAGKIHNNQSIAFHNSWAQNDRCGILGTVLLSWPGLCVLCVSLPWLLHMVSALCIVWRIVVDMVKGKMSVYKNGKFLGDVYEY